MEGAYTGGPIKKGKRKAGGGLTRETRKTKKEKLEGAYTGGPIKTRKRKAGGDSHWGN